MKNFTGQLNSAAAGAAINYHVGRNLEDCPMKVLASVRGAFNEGRIDLLQERIANGFRYFAVKKARVAVPSDDLRFTPTHMVQAFA